MDIVRCEECSVEYEGVPTTWTRKCPQCGSASWVHVREISGKAPCPHCGHEYHWRTFTACPRCDLARDAPLGTVAPGSPQAQKQASDAFSALPADERTALLLEQLLAEQKRATSRLTGIATGIAVLILFLFFLPLIFR